MQSEDDDFWYRKGNALFDLKRYEEALEAYEKAIELNPEDAADAWNGKGSALEALGRYEEALEAYEKAIELNPEDAADAWYDKGDALFDLKRYDEALEAYEKAIELNLEDAADAWYDKGNALYNLKRYDEALEAYEKAIELNLENPADAWYDKGDALHNLKRYDEALEAYEKAIELNLEDVADAWNGKGNALYDLERYKEALKAYEKAIELDPKHANAWYNKGLLLETIEEYDKALEAYEKAIELNLEDPADAWNGKGNTLYNLGRYEEALEAYEKAIELNPEDAADAWYNKGLLLETIEEYKEALKAYEKAIELNPKISQPHESLGMLYFMLGDLENASQKVKELLKENEKNTFALKEPLNKNEKKTFALMLKGKIEIERKDYLSAVKSFEEAICSSLANLDPLLWEIYAEYLSIEFGSKMEDKECKEGIYDTLREREYQEEITAIIRKLERIDELFKKEKEESKPYTLYLLGYFYYKSGDVFAAREKLEECIRTKTEQEGSEFSTRKRANELLDNIWKYRIRPSWWEWWLFSPLNRLKKRILFSVILSSSFLLLILHPFVSLILHPFVSTCFFVKVNWSVYMILVLFLIFLLLSPGLKSIKAEGIGVELSSPPSLELVLSPLRMEVRIKEFEKLHRR
jgi:tetratricopeptide (TPR) repeat protein